MEMDERKILILQAIINDYINTAEPVGSRTIARKHNLGISSATIRNEMADLEEMGYIEQLHTSSGRKPSDKGYRLYVDKLMKKTELSPEEKYIIKTQLLDAAIYEIDKIMKQATVLLSELTKLTCIVKAPSTRKACVKSIQLISISSSNILSVIVTDSGIIKSNVINVSKTVSDSSLLAINNILNAKLRNLTIDEINLTVINDLKKSLAGFEDIFNEIISVIYEGLNSEDSEEVYLEGASNIFNYPEFKDIDKAREFMSLLDHKSQVLSLMKNKDGFSISIGAENYLQQAKEISIISAEYSIGGRSLGSIGVIGPTRMPYSKVISIISKIVEEISENITRRYMDDR